MEGFNGRTSNPLNLLDGRILGANFKFLPLIFSYLSSSCGGFQTTPLKSNSSIQRNLRLEAFSGSMEA